MIHETNFEIVYSNFNAYLHDASDKWYMDDFENDVDVINLYETSLDFYVHDETSKVVDFMEATSHVLCSNKNFECVEVKPKFRPSIEEPPTLEHNPLSNHLQCAYLSINKTLFVIISLMLSQEQQEKILCFEKM